MIYIIGAPRQPVKIGYSNNKYTLASRISAHQTSYPFTLELIFQADGTLNDEQRCHRLLAQHKLNGEWFGRHKDVEKFIGDAARQGLQQTLLNLEEQEKRVLSPPAPAPDHYTKCEKQEGDTVAVLTTSKRILRPKEVRMRLGGICNSTLYAWVQKGILPPPQKIAKGVRCSGWPEETINALITRLN